MMIVGTVRSLLSFYAKSRSVKSKKTAVSMEMYEQDGFVIRMNLMATFKC